MYLNDFRVSEILKVIEEIRVIDPPDLIYKIGISENANNDIAYLHYVKDLHRLDAFYFNPMTEALYPNPQATTTLAPAKEFIKRLVPNNTYKLLMSAK